MLELAVARGAMRLVKEEGATDIVQKLGISPENLDKVKSDTPWKGTDREIVVRTLNALNHGTCDIVGIPRIALPAEYVAASIATHVHPVNTKIACNYMEVTASAKEMAGSNQKSVMHKPVTPEQLFSIVVLLQETQAYVSSDFTNAVQKAVDEYMEAQPVV